MTEAQPAEKQNIPEFLAFRGGPFYELQRRLKMLRENSLDAGRRAVIYTALAWAVPLLLALAAGLSLDGSGYSYFSDPAAWARFLIAIGAFVLSEQQVEKALRAKLSHFQTSRLIADTSLQKATEAVNHALKQRNSFGAELICALIAAIAAIAVYTNLHAAPVSSWAVSITTEGHRITPAGWWSILVSMPLFVFLFVRGLWRHLVWSQLLRRIAKLELRLVATHPDGKAGLAFLAHYPNAYAFFVFGISCALAAGLAKHLLNEQLSVTTLTVVMGGWLAIVLAVFAYPLAAFTAPLFMLKEKSLLLLSAKATEYNRLAERTALGRNIFANSDAEAGDSADIDDPTKLYGVTGKQSTILLTRAAVIPVGLASLAPFAAAAATQLPYKEIFSVLKKLLLL
ncbi:hypothetical protein JJB09_09680 [Rhizobium sp. KVB221]|uniref:Uncharacterized protein n=1 Tax=Rhizobium setariae TaxID=2801340 RepID=A0A936YT76_9HYPH|nr:hypothetical protein [Rhizobium setariae]MBL0372297.1 hypothetical protein [Rhizobium setariae]